MTFKIQRINREVLVSMLRVRKTNTRRTNSTPTENLKPTVKLRLFERTREILGRTDEVLVPFALLPLELQESPTHKTSLDAVTLFTSSAERNEAAHAIRGRALGG